MARVAMSFTFWCTSRGVDSAYWLFSQTKRTGRFQTAARFSPSWKAPVLEPPSPKKATVTALRPCIFAVRPAPAAMGMPAPTMPFAPRIPRSRSAMCMEPPFPLQ